MSGEDVLPGFARLFVLLGPKGQAPGEEPLLRVVRELATSSRLPEPRIYRAQVKRFTAVGERSRPIKVLRAQDAGDLYRVAHEGAILVITSPDVRVLMDPRKEPATHRTVSRPVDVLRHKALVLTAQDEQTLRTSIARLGSIHPGDIQGIRDPRLLPLHLFDGPDDQCLLETPAGRNAFILEHGRGRSWVGPKGEWQDADPHARHGRPGHSGPTIVSGWQVPDGHHWDVQSLGNGTELVGLDAVWSVKRGGYVNAYPDSHIGGGHRSRRVWSPE